MHEEPRANKPWLASTQPSNTPEWNGETIINQDRSQGVQKRKTRPLETTPNREKPKGLAARKREQDASKATQFARLDALDS